MLCCLRSGRPAHRQEQILHVFNTALTLSDHNGTPIIPERRSLNDTALHGAA